MLETIRIYSLLTVLCALIIRSDLLPESDTLATLFLQASETMLRLYLSQDIAAPSSTSLSIRILQAACHHFVGTPNLAWHSIDEAVRLTLQMRLYDERSYEHLEPIEAKLCRNSFWHLYASDRSASLLNSRPLQLDKFHLEVSFTALEHLDKLPPLLDQTRLEHQGVFEDLLMQGFRKDHEVWDLGQAVLSDLRLFLATNNRAGERADMTPGQERALSELYLRFLSIVDDFPTHIASPATFHATDENITEYQRRAFWVQNANIMITYHYLRMKILDRFIDAELPHLLGVSSSPLSLAWKKVEIGHDLFCVLTGVPFEALQSNGEPCATPSTQAELSPNLLATTPSVMVRRNYTEDDVAEAIFDTTDRGLSQNEAAQKRGVPQWTISRRLSGQASRNERIQAHQRIPKSQEETLIRWVLRQESLGYAPSHSQVRACVEAILQQQGDNKPLGKHWTTRFVKRHPKLSTKIGKRQEAARFDGFTPKAVNWYFDIRENEYGWIKPENTVNVDEGGIMVGFGKSS
ncbi:hypothetical protein BFJ69_g17824, partial [Fusarium oxysporum]